ncbi:MAG: hypothetical protein K1W34_14535 [Lachnospiraceae bacterium]
MINGISIFREHFSNFKEQYTVIGGFACDLLMNDAGLDFRQTVDIDMVLTVEALTADFAKAFWLFIEAGGYQARQRSNGKPEFYRFVEPTNPAYPKMIELFSRPQSHVVLQPDTHLMPLHIDDEVSSLSAILLNDGYYRFLLDGRTVIDGISILDAEHIIPLKMKAWLDLKSKRAEGLHVNSRDIKKHRLDVFRLFQLVREGQKITVPKSVGEDITQFIAQMRETEIRLTDIGINRPKDSILDIYSNMYATE